MADTKVLEAFAVRCAGSSPVPGTILRGEEISAYGSHTNWAQESAQHAKGHAVVTATDGREGLKIVQSQPFDILVTDLVMPDQDGLEVLQVVRKQHPHIRVIVMSGDSPRHAELYLKIARQLGAHQTLLKPFAIEALLAAIAESPGEPRDEKPAS